MASQIVLSGIPSHISIWFHLPCTQAHPTKLEQSSKTLIANGKTKGKPVSGMGASGETLPSVPPRHTHHATGIERPWCVESLPSHISKTAVSTVSGGGPKLTVGRTIFEMWMGL